MKNIVFDHVVKAYGGTQVVKDLNIEIKEGERLILLGPSGCGKSTTLRMIAGLENVTDGSIYMNGERVNDIPCGKRNVSMVFQNYALFPHMTVEQNITYGLKANKMDSMEIKSRLKEVIKMLELEGLEQRKPKDLSGGQRQRVALARAVVKRADYFLLDEPLSNLDAQLRLRARKELVKIHKMYNPTLIYVTHDQVEAMTVGERIALMHEGILQMVDTPSNIYNRPSNIFTARFIGSPPMNILEVNYLEGNLIIEGEKIKLPDVWCRQVKEHGKEKLYFGIRPEDISISRCAGKGIDGIVSYIEDYGNKRCVFVDIGKSEIAVVSDCDIPSPGETVSMIPNFDKIHIFDRITGNSIGYPHRKGGDSK
ncbi:sn-glycerol-3-phosphate import ATP-binding protein UgpC [Lachnospiraceae bacterium]|nr:sn-glycerol-3-phosphate import ATP-binding protein UgpC [Lachnospiraceae bacterium]